MADKKPMVGWYDPGQLVPTAVRAAISTVFGEYADQREAVAGARPLDPRAIDAAHDYSTRAGDDGLWLDFLADTGDGWDPTYAIARLLAARDIEVKAGTGTLDLPRARILVLGGDQVYPAASREDYRLRFVAPFEAAYRSLPPEEKWARAGAPDLYAIPGNHDWYDGLQSFLGVFCRRRLAGEWVASRDGRVIGGRCTQQTRSYFALKLPQNWWLCGLDIQLAGYIDQPQVDFFAHVATKWMTGADGRPANIILCTGAPQWIYAREKHPDSFRNLDYLEAVLTKPGHRLRLVLTGDMHNYSRYVDDVEDHGVKIDGASYPRHYVTAGGGGAFLHPTHQLPKTNAFTIAFTERGQDSRSERAFTLAAKDGGRGHACYPGAGTSRLLALGDLFFALLNLPYTLTLAGLFALYTWMLDAAARATGYTLRRTIFESLLLGDPADAMPPLVVTGWPLPDWTQPWSAAALTTLNVAVQSPGPLMLALAALFAYVYLADCRRRWTRWLLGLGHTLVQFAGTVAVIVLLARFWPTERLVAWLGDNLAWIADPLFIAAVAAGAGIVSATIMGVYLLLGLSLKGIHWNEAFSALRLDGYKNFVRLHLATDGTLRLYAIGLRKVPEDHGREPRNPELAPHLIEGPVVIPGHAPPPPPAPAASQTAHPV